MACIRDEPGTNLGQHSDISESYSWGIFSVAALYFVLIKLDRRNYLPYIILSPIINP